MARNQFYSELVGAFPYERRNALSKIRDHIKFILANDGVRIPVTPILRFFSELR